MGKSNGNGSLVKGYSYFILFALFAIIGYIILKDANWVIGDDSLFLRTTMLGKPSHSWVGQGRFWPLGLFDYSILTIIPGGQTTIAHFIYNVVVMVISVLLLFQLLYYVGKNYLISLFCSVLLFCSSSFLQLHMDCIYPERFMFFLQVLFIYFWWKGRKEQSGVSYVISWFSATCLILSKEPVFGMIFVIVSTNLIFGWERLSEKEKNFHFACGISAFLFVWLYVYIFFGIFNTSNLYGGGILIFFSEVDAWETIKLLIFKETLLIPIFILTIVRAYFVLIKSDRKNLPLDSLLFGASAYAVAYIIMVMPSTYYVFPSIVFALPSFSYWLSWLWKRSKTKFWVTVFALIVSIIPSIYISKNWVETFNCYRRNDMPILEDVVKGCSDDHFVYVYMNGVPLNHYISDRVYADSFWFHAWKDFIEYVLKNKVDQKKTKELDRENAEAENLNRDDGKASDFSKTMNVFKFVESLEDIPDGGTVLCSPKLLDRDKRLRKRFPLSHEWLGMDVYYKVKNN